MLLRQSSQRFFKSQLQRLSCRRVPPFRGLTSAEVSTALRPFYFLVHPDLFGKFPKEQAVNEDSLKSLKSHLDIMLGGQRKPPQPLQVSFYLKPHISHHSHHHARHKSPNRASLKSVSLNLSEGRVRQAVLSILKGANLPTSYVDSIPEVMHEHLRESQHYDCDESYESHQVSKGLHSTDLRHPLRDWLKENMDVARHRLAANVPTRLEIERLQDELCYKLGLEDILWECDWDLSHRRGGLDSFAAMAENHPEIRDILHGRSLVFGRFSGVDLDGQVILYSGEVRVNWLNAIKNVPRSNALLQMIPRVEESLSRAFLDIRVVRRRFQPITLVEDYRARLRRLLTTVNDIKSKGGFPSSWPSSLRQFELCVESEASPLMVSPTGQFIVPANCPKFLLTSFIDEHLEEARQLMAGAEQGSQEELQLVTLCVNELGLIDLERDESIGNVSMIECCTRLLQYASHIRHLTHGNHLVVTRYYSVLSDGTICIPWNWREW